MLKYLFIGLLALLAYVIFRGLHRPKGRGGVPAAMPVEQMVACAQCGVNIPENESMESGGHFYCCREHREIGPRNPGN